MSKLGIIVRSDLGSGLQSQTLNLTRLLNPYKILHINSFAFNKRMPDYTMYKQYASIDSFGFPNRKTAVAFLHGLTHVLTAETFYNHDIVRLAQTYNIKTFNHTNYEFCDHLNQNLTLPTKLLMPSYWHLAEMKHRFNNVEYIPPPIFLEDFINAKERNISRTGKKRFVHIVGKQAVHDRNGTEDLIESLKYSRGNFDLVIRTQYKLSYEIKDKRVIIETGNLKKQEDLYRDFDLMILPRRYGGLCLPMNEALCSALPVLMTDIEPNNNILPKEWLVKSRLKLKFKTRVMIECYKSDLKDLASRLDYFASLSDKSLLVEKWKAFNIGSNEFSADNLKDKFIEVMGL